MSELRIAPEFGAVFQCLPGFLDRKLAREAYEGQQGDQPLAAGYRDNLYQPLPGDAGAHGRFDAVAAAASWQFRLSRHRWTIAGLLVISGLLAGWSLRRRLVRPPPSIA